MKPTASATVAATVRPGSQRRRRCSMAGGSEAAVAPVLLELVAIEHEADQDFEFTGMAAGQRNVLLELLAHHDAPAPGLERNPRDEILARQHILLLVDHGDEIGHLGLVLSRRGAARGGHLQDEAHDDDRAAILVAAV